MISFNPGIGSFGQYTGLLKVRSGTSNFQTVTKAFLQSSENDFPYLNGKTKKGMIMYLESFFDDFNKRNQIVNKLRSECINF